MKYIYSNDFGTGDRAKISFSREKRKYTHKKKKNRRNYNNDTIRHKIILPAASSFLTPHYVISVLITVFLDKLRSGG